MPKLAVQPTGSLHVLGDDELTLFLEYEGLPAHQLGQILLAVGNLNQAIFDALWDIPWERDGRDLRPELQVTSAQTGESIKLKFREGKVFPGFEFPDDDLVVVLPRWTAGLFLASALLVGGAEALSSWDTVMKHLPHHVQQQVQQQINVKQLVDPNSRVGKNVRYNLAAFERETTSPNFLEVRINDVAIRRREEEADA